MKLTVTNTNFLNRYDWIFELKDDNEKLYYIMDTPFYKQLNLKSPISKKHLDSLDKGQAIDADVIDFSGRNVVISIIE